MALIPFDPFRALRRRDDDFENLFREFFKGAGGDALEPPVEVSETETELTVKLPIPGVDKDHLEVNVADDSLTVRGEMRKESEEKKKNYYRQEIRYGSFHRIVPLPVEVDAAKANAELANGMLTVKLPKSAHTRSHKVKVTAA